MAVTERMARACSRHPWRTIGAWVGAVLLAVAALALLLGDLTTNGHPTNNPESQRADAMIGRAFPPNPALAASDLVVVSSPRYTVDAPQFRTFVPRLVTDGRATGAISNASDYDFNKLSQHDLKSGELKFGVPAALVILILVFGAVVAGLVPLLMAIISIIAALGLVAVLSQPFNLSVFIINMLSGMGLALGIDYSLFVVSRYREERASGREQLEAIGGAGATASRAVLVSGTAFVVAMCGMMIVPNNIMRSLALGAILVGIVSVIAALTLLPALLGLLGDRVNALRIPFVGRAALETANPEGRFWHAVVERVLRRPALSLLVAGGILVAAALPVFGLDIGTNGVSTLPDRLASKRGFIALERNFPGVTTDPAEVVVAEGYGSRADEALMRLRDRLATDPRFGRGQVIVAPDGSVGALRVPVRGDSAGSEAVGAVRELRSDLIPENFAGTGAKVLVGGDTAENIDYFDSVIDPAPIVLLFVLGLTFVLLTIVFRSG